jgi:hypothetical protein
MTTINGVEVYQEGNVWYVKFTQDGIEKVSEPFITEENAITYSLNLKFI